jgi:hypothetical protein
MDESSARWDGQKWISQDGLWVWNGSSWHRAESKMPLAARLAIYGVAGLALNLPMLWVLGLAWGLTGPGWDASPPDVVASLVQIALTLVGGVLAFCASWFLLRVDARDWWLGAVFGWLWIASSGVLLGGSFVTGGPDTTALPMSALLLLFVGFPLAGSIVGYRWGPSLTARSPRSGTRIGALLPRAIKSTWLFVQAFIRAFFEATARP